MIILNIKYSLFITYKIDKSSSMAFKSIQSNLLPPLIKLQSKERKLSGDSQNNIDDCELGKISNKISSFDLDDLFAKDMKIITEKENGKMNVDLKTNDKNDNKNKKNQQSNKKRIDKSKITDLEVIKILNGFIFILFLIFIVCLNLFGLFILPYFYKKSLSIND